jgi:hypothetical protein
MVADCRALESVPLRDEHCGRGAEASGDLVAVLSRWEVQGGQWRVVTETEARLTVGLMSCGGEEMSRVTGSGTTALTAFLDGGTASSA